MKLSIISYTTKGNQKKIFTYNWNEVKPKGLIGRIYLCLV